MGEHDKAHHVSNIEGNTAPRPPTFQTRQTPDSSAYPEPSLHSFEISEVPSAGKVYKKIITKSRYTHIFLTLAHVRIIRR